MLGGKGMIITVFTVRTLWKVITWMMKIDANVTKVRCQCKWLRIMSNERFCVGLTSTDFSTTRVSYSLYMP